MRHEMLTQRALSCIDSNTKKGTLSQQFVTKCALSCVDSNTKRACFESPCFVKTKLRTSQHGLVTILLVFEWCSLRMTFDPHWLQRLRNFQTQVKSAVLL